MPKQLSVTKDYYRIRYVGHFDFNGAVNGLAYVLSWAVEGEKQERSRIDVRNLSTGKEHTVSAGGTSEISPRFSPDGSRLLFVSNASGSDQIYVIPSGGGEAQQLTSMPNGASNPVWSPGGDRFVFLSPIESGDEPNEKEERPVIIEDYGYKSDEAGGFSGPKGEMQLWVADLSGGGAKMLSGGKRDHVMPVWYPDGKRILVVSNRERPREQTIGQDLFSISVDGEEIKQLTKKEWVAYYPAPFQPVFTPDGSNLVFAAMLPSLEGGVPLTKLCMVSAEGGEVKNLWPESPPCHEATCFLYNADNIFGRGITGRVSEDGKSLYFISGWDGRCNIYKAALEGEPEITLLKTDAASYRGLGVPFGGKMIVSKCSFTSTQQLFSLDLATGTETSITDSNPWFAETGLSKPMELWMNTLDGDGRVQGWVLPPQNREEGKKYPAVLYIHGGPTPFYGNAMTYEHQALAGAGIAVIFCNPRGSSGYGAKHQNMKQANDGTAMYDLLQFTGEACRCFSWIDPQRIGVTGGSYGGFMTNELITKTKRFKAAVTQRSIANHLIQYASSDMAGSSKNFKSFEDFMLDQIQSSPVAYADKIDIPLLILHGLNDMRCPVEHAHQFFTAVKDTHPDLPVRMVLFPGANHNLTSSGAMKHRIRHYDETIEWFRKYL